MSEPIKPALTAEEWAIVNNPFEDFDEEKLVAGRRPARAALNLYGQPFGFTREDVTNLRWVVDDALLLNSHIRRDLSDLADRIEALLPPEKEGA